MLHSVAAVAPRRDKAATDMTQASSMLQALPHSGHEGLEPIHSSSRSIMGCSHTPGQEQLGHGSIGQSCSRQRGDSYICIVLQCSPYLLGFIVEGVGKYGVLCINVAIPATWNMVTM